MFLIFLWAHPDSEDQGRSTAIRARPQRVTGQAEGGLPPDRLNRLQVEGACPAIAALTKVIAEPLADRRRNVLVPLDRAGFERKIVPAGFLRDLAVALARVE